MPEAAGTVTGPENEFKRGLLMEMKLSSRFAFIWIYRSTDLCPLAYSTEFTTLAQEIRQAASAIRIQGEAPGYTPTR